MTFEENDIAMDIPKYPEVFIYFLLKKNEVVYVGQTKNGITRPLAHRTSKDFDKIKIITCKETELDLLEDKYIKKYLPIHNKTIDCKINCRIEVARQIVEERLGRSITLFKIKKIIRNLEIKTYFVNCDIYIAREDIEKIIKYEVQPWK